MDFSRSALPHPEPAEAVQPRHGPRLTHRSTPGPRPCGGFRRAIRGRMPRRRGRRRCGAESSPRSAYHSRGRRLGRPGVPRTGRIASTACSNASTSGGLAAVVVAASGTPPPSVTTKCLRPRLRRSTGLGPVASPPPRAREVPPSIAARLQSIWPAPSGSARSRSCSLAQTPARVRSRRAPPAGPAAAAARLLRQALPVDAGLEDEEGAGEAPAVVDGLAAGVAAASGPGRGDEALEPAPEGVGDEGLGPGGVLRRPSTCGPRASFCWGFSRR